MVANVRPVPDARTGSRPLGPGRSPAADECRRPSATRAGATDRWLRKRRVTVQALGQAHHPRPHHRWRTRPVIARPASAVRRFGAVPPGARPSSARRPIAFFARTSVLAPTNDCDERWPATRCRTHAPCRVPPPGRTRPACAAVPWLSSRCSSARICFSSASETRLKLAYSPQPGHVPRSPAHEKRQPQKQVTSIGDSLPRPPTVPAAASSRP